MECRQVIRSSCGSFLCILHFSYLSGKNYFIFYYEWKMSSVKKWLKCVLPLLEYETEKVHLFVQDVARYYSVP